MAGYDYDTIKTQLETLQTAITTALQNPRPDWQVGQVRMSQAGYLKMLFEQQKQLMDLMTTHFPAEQITTSQERVTLLGHDLTDYHNEDFG